MTALENSDFKEADRSQCTYRCVVLPDMFYIDGEVFTVESQCIYRCVVLPDERRRTPVRHDHFVSMHLQVLVLPDTVESLRKP